MRKLIATRPVLYLGRIYAVGEYLPLNNQVMINAWLNAGSAKWDSKPAKQDSENADAIDISDGHFTEESLMRMTKAELAELAADLGTDISGCKNKTEIVAVLLEVEIPPQEDAPELGAEDPVL